MRYILLSFLLIIPDTVSAALVPCGAGQGGLEPCQTCHIIALVNNIIVWLMGMLAMIAVMALIYAGFMFVLSRGESSQIQKGRKIFANILVGLLIVFFAWFIVDTIAEYLLGAEGGAWNTISCVAQPEWNTELISYPPYAATNPAVCSNGSLSADELSAAGCDVTTCSAASNAGPGPSCADRCEQQGGTLMPAGGVGGDTDFICSSVPEGDFPEELPDNDACDPSVVSGYFGGFTNQARCIISAESTCGASPLSRTDVGPDGRPFSFGAMQINLTVHELQGCGPGGSTLNCPDAFNGTNYSGVIVNEQLYQQCATAAQNVDCNLSNGRRIFDGRRSRQPSNPWGDWSTAGACGL